VVKENQESTQKLKLHILESNLPIARCMRDVSEMRAEDASQVQEVITRAVSLPPFRNVPDAFNLYEQRDRGIGRGDTEDEELSTKGERGERPFFTVA